LSGATEPNFHLNRLKKALGSHAHICTENKELPKIMKSLFLASMIKA
jgi:hypothetical protein